MFWCRGFVAFPICGGAILADASTDPSLVMRALSHGDKDCQTRSASSSVVMGHETFSRNRRLGARVDSRRTYCRGTLSEIGIGLWYWYGREGKGPWGVEYTLAVIGTGGQYSGTVKRRNGTVLVRR
eukprot:2195621-Pyramimonas_sp.AAC.1